MNLIITASTLILITNIEFIYKSIVLICKQNTMINKNNFQKLYSNDLSTVKMFSITSYLAVIISFTIILSAIDNHKTNYYEEFYIKILDEDNKKIDLDNKNYNLKKHLDKKDVKIIIMPKN